MLKRPARDYRQHLEVETPEHVVLDYEIAGVGSRTLAATADWIIIVLMSLVIALGFGLAPRGGSWFGAVLILVLSSLVWGYFTCFEGLRGGQTPGKRALGIRVIRDTGHAVTFADAAARNLLLPLDLFGLLGVFMIAIHPRAKRLGDIVAGTVVVRDQPVETRHQAPAAAEAEDASGAPELSDEEFRLLREFSDRAATLPTAVRFRLAHGLAARLGPRYPDRPAGDLQFLEQLYRDELARRRGRFGARSSGAPGRAARSGVTERLVALKSGRWAEFQVQADLVTRKGLDGLAAEELPDFARRYREVAADLARARTYGADGPVLLRLERLVASGHGALYRQERRTWRKIWDFISRECPAAIVESRRYVAIAFLTFMLPALGGYTLLRERPALAPELLPDVMLERAEAGAARKAGGLGYVKTDAPDRPVMATGIITNNIRVAFSCFAGGIAFGVGALVLLAFNGLEIGATSGYFANMGLLGYLWTFVIGHGVLELFAIWVAGAAGFMLGRAIIAPGELPRRDAVVLAGRHAIKMIGAVVVLLLVAGTIEGFVSSGEAPVSVRIGVSIASVLFLVLYLLNGTRPAPAA